MCHLRWSLPPSGLRCAAASLGRPWQKLANMDEKPSAASGLTGSQSVRPPNLGASPQHLSDNFASRVDLSWGSGFSKRQAIMGWCLLGLCFLGIIWGSLPGYSWFPQNAEPWEYAVCLGVSLVTRFLCGLIIYEYEGWQVAAALVANRKVTPDITGHTRSNILSIQKQGALESLFGGRQLILVSTVLFPTVVEAAFYPLLPSFQVNDGSYYAGLAKVTVKTLSFAVIICILAQLSSQIKAIGGPISWMRRRTTKYVIWSVGFAEKLGLIIPSRLMARRLFDHHELDGQPGTVHEWANWWSEKIAVQVEDVKTPPPFLLPPDHTAHIMPHKVLNFLLSQQHNPRFQEEIVPSFIYASIHGLDLDEPVAYWEWIEAHTAGDIPGTFPANHPFIWRTGADSLGHIPPHHMIMVLFSSYLLILKTSATPERDIEQMFDGFAKVSFGDEESFRDYWSSVRKFRIGHEAPLVGTG